MEDINSIIEELEEEFAKSKSGLFGKKTNMERCEELIEELKRSMPEQIQEANYILSQRDKIIQQAKDMADKTLKEAEVRAEQLLSDSELIKKSEEEAEEIVDNAEKKANQLFAVTRENIDKLLKSVEDYLLQNLHVVRSNREELGNGDVLKNVQSKPKK
ncbi:MAG: hypothetical protein IJS74_03340 [Clostridia bacterium]|nr:hypothetical protein [Clostridia bacterium]